MMKFVWMFAAFLPHMTLGDNSNPSEKYMIPDSNNYCNDLNPQNSLDFNLLMGLWYGAEIITHHETDSYETVYDSCVVVFISDLDTRQTEDYDYTNYHEKNERRHYDMKNTYNFHNSDKRLKLVWDERGKTLQYALRVNRLRKGFWISSGAQTDRQPIGTMLELSYNQFAGTVQVMKVTGNQLVLTFCETSPKQQFFTIILTRKPHMLTRDDLQMTRNLLRRRGLSVQSVRKVCKNSATSVAVGILTILTSSIVFLLSRNF